MANDVPAWRQYLSEKLNPVQPSIAAQEPFSSPENIVDFEKAYREIEIVHRSVDMVINALVEVPLIIEGGSPSKKVNKLLQNKYDPAPMFTNKHPIMSELMKKMGVTRGDSVTFYGKVNQSEFFAENLTVYIHSNEYMKQNHPKTYNFIEALLKEYGIFNTFKIAK